MRTSKRARARATTVYKDKALRQRPRISIVGQGRLGRALATALLDAGARVNGPLGRGETPDEHDAILLCVPEPAIVEVAASLAPGTLVGHCSASAPLAMLAPHERFVMHPLMTFTRAGGTFTGATAAIDGSSERAITAAEELVTLLGMRPVRVAAERRALYHAAAVMASNFLVALEDAAERVGAAAGVDHAALAPLARAALENWARLGTHVAITGPIARGDKATEARLRRALSEQTPEMLPLWDALAAATKSIGDRPAPPSQRRRR